MCFRVLEFGVWDLGSTGFRLVFGLNCFELGGLGLDWIAGFLDGSVYVYMYGYVYWYVYALKRRGAEGRGGEEGGDDDDDDDDDDISCAVLIPVLSCSCPSCSRFTNVSEEMDGWTDGRMKGNCGLWTVDCGGQVKYLPPYCMNHAEEEAEASKPRSPLL